jgi:non-ribosomal peptide synthetase component F
MLFATISSGRSADPELLNAAGMFVKTLPAVVKGEEDGDRPAADYVREIYQQLQETIAREDYPYTRLVEEHRVQAEIFFGFQDGVQNASDADDRLKSIPLFLDAAKFPVSITISPAEDSYVITLEYDGTRYGRTDMETLASAIGQTALSLVTAEKMKDVSMLNGEEEEKILALSRGEALV